MLVFILDVVSNSPRTFIGNIESKRKDDTLTKSTDDYDNLSEGSMKMMENDDGSHGKQSSGDFSYINDNGSHGNQTSGDKTEKNDGTPPQNAVMCAMKHEQDDNTLERKVLSYYDAEDESENVPRDSNSPPLRAAPPSPSGVPASPDSTRT